MTTATSLTVVIPTQNRPNSLRETLTCLEKADRTGIDVNIIVLDNNTDNNATKSIFDDFRNRLPLQFLSEPTLGIYGKSHAINRALDDGKLGDIIAILDDDMSPEQNWFQGVAAIPERWPTADLFSGNSYIIWPDGPIPDWAKDSRIRGWAYSVFNRGNADMKLEKGRNFSGNHFWFRSRMLDSGLRFKDIWMTEPDFMFSAIELGFKGISCPDARAGHRIQNSLLEKAVIMDRASKVGKNFAQTRLIPYRQSIKHAYICKKFPILYRICCFLNLLRWGVNLILGNLRISGDRRYAEKVVAAERIAFFCEALKIVSRSKDYRIRFPIISKRNGF